MIPTQPKTEKNREEEETWNEGVKREEEKNCLLLMAVGVT